MARRKLLPTSPDFSLPGMGDNEESIRTYIKAVSVGVATSKIDARTGDALNNLAKTAIATIKLREDLHEMQQLRDMLQQVKSLQLKGMEREFKDRTHLS